MAGMGELQKASNEVAGELEINVKITYDHVKVFLEGFKKLIKECSKTGEEISFQKFLSVEFKQIKAREFRNPQDPDGERIKKPAKYVPRARFKKNFENEVNSLQTE